MTPPAFPEFCPQCGGRLAVREEEVIVRGGPHAAIFRTWVGVCTRCGEHLYTMDTVQRKFRLKKLLEQGEFQGLHPIGQVYSVQGS